MHSIVIGPGLGRSDLAWKYAKVYLKRKSKKTLMGQVNLMEV